MERQSGPEAFSLPFYLEHIRQAIQQVDNLEDMKAFLERLAEDLIRGEEAHQLRRQEELCKIQEAMDALHYAISHDLRAPLRSIEGFSQILAEDYAESLGAEGRYVIQTITASAGKMNRLISDLLRLSRLGGQQPLFINRLSCPQLIGDLWPSLMEAETSSREVDLRIQEPMPALVGDESLLRQLLACLLSNALKYTRRTSLPAVIEVGGNETDGRVQFFIRDNGTGFDMRYADKIFTALSRLVSDSDYEGTGTGLAIAKRVVERHGGRIWAESQPGAGATFFFELPSVSMS